MYFCKSKKHVWSNKEDAEKCCNGYKRVLVVRNINDEALPEDAKAVKIDPETGMQWGRIWVKEEAAEHSF